LLRHIRQTLIIQRCMHGKSTLEMNNHAQPTPYAGASKRSSPTASFKGSCLNHEALTARPSAFAAARCSKSAFGATSAEGLRAVALPASRLYRTSTSHGAREGGQLALWDTPVRPRDLLPSYSRKWQTNLLSAASNSTARKTQSLHLSAS